jgi:hypothetical protein
LQYHPLFMRMALAPTSAAMLPSAGNRNSDRTTSIFQFILLFEDPT